MGTYLFFEELKSAKLVKEVTVLRILAHQLTLFPVLTKSTFCTYISLEKAFLIYKYLKICIHLITAPLEGGHHHTRHQAVVTRVLAN